MEELGLSLEGLQTWPIDIFSVNRIAYGLLRYLLISVWCLLYGGPYNNHTQEQMDLYIETLDLLQCLLRNR